MAAGINSLPFPIYGAAYRIVFPWLDADGDLVTGVTGADTEVSKDCGTFNDCTNEATEIATTSGMKYLDLTYLEMTADIVSVISKGTGVKTTPIVIYPQRLGQIRTTETAQAGAEGTITLHTNAAAKDDFYRGCYIRCTNNTPAGVQGLTRFCSNYTGSTKLAYVSPNWAVTPTSGTSYEILVPENAIVSGWNGQQMAEQDTTGFPKVTVKSGTGTGELNLSSGVAQANAVQIASSTQRATDLAEIARYLFQESATLATIIADNSVMAKLLATGGDISGFAEATDSLQSIRDALVSGVVRALADDGEKLKRRKDS